MRNLYHDTRSVSRFVFGFGTAVLHVLKYLQSLVYQFMALSSMYVDHHAYATCVVLVLALIQSCAVLLSLCHIFICFCFPFDYIRVQN